MLRADARDQAQVRVEQRRVFVLVVLRPPAPCARPALDPLVQVEGGAEETRPHRDEKILWVKPPVRPW